jgi:arginase
MNLAVIGVPYSSAGPDTAEALAPRVLREEGLISELAQHNEVADFGDIPLASATAGQRNGALGSAEPESQARVIAATRSAVERAYDDRRMPVVIGGDRALLLGCLLAARDQLGYGPAVLYVDGREGGESLHDSTAGEAAGTVLEFALGFAKAGQMAGLTDTAPLLDPHQVVLLGPHDRAESGGADRPSINDRVIVLDDAELRGAGIEMTVKRWLDQFQRNPGRFWFHLSWDVLSSEAMPAVSHAQAGGLTWDEVGTIARAAMHADHLIGLDVGLYNPLLDPDRASARKIVSLLAGLTRGPERISRPRRM